MTLSLIRTCKILLTAMLVSLSSITVANDDKSVLIPTPEDAQVFANFSSDFPAVMNFFTSLTENEVIQFYQETYGEAIYHEQKRERLTYIYQKEKQN